MSNYLSKTGLIDLEKELKILNEIKIPKILDAINRAIAEGDLSENSSLDSARDEQEKLLGRKGEIEEVLANYQIIDESKLSVSKIVRIGSTVKVLFIDTNKTLELKIVGSSEANALDNKISNESPLAQSIIDQEAGVEVTFKQNKQIFQVKILSIN